MTIHIKRQINCGMKYSNSHAEDFSLAKSQQLFIVNSLYVIC